MTGALEVSSITVDGAGLELDDVLADVTIRHGRTGFFDSSSPSTCQLTLLGVTRALTRPFRLGSTLVVNATDGATIAPRFTGRFTDAQVDGDTLTAIAVGDLRTLPGYELVAAYPEEKWSARVLRVFTAAGLAPTNRVTNPDFETNTTPWVGWSPGTGQPAISRSTDPAHVAAGTYALFVTAPNPDAVQRFSMVWGAAVPCTPGQRFRLRVVGSGGGFRLGVRDNGGGFNDILNRPDLFQPIEGLVYTGANRVQLGGIFTAGAGHTSIAPGIAADIAAGQTGYAAADLFELYPVTEDRLLLQVGSFDPILAAEAAPAGDRNLGGYLDELAAMVAAAVCDLPDGRILVQAIESRSFANMVPLDPAEVEYAPTWELRLPQANTVTVKYGAGSALEVTVTDPASVALYGPIAATISTTFRDLTDAQRAGNARVAAGSFARWTTPAAPLLVGRRLPIGGALELSMLPAAAPFDPWTPTLEGWTDRIVSDGFELDWRMELALADPIYSALALPWNQVPAAYLWNTINQSVQWRDALTLSDLKP